MTNEELIVTLNQEAEKALLQVGYFNGRRALALELAALLAEQTSPTPPPTVDAEKEADE